MSEEIWQTGHGRVFLQVGGADPGNSLEYQDMARLGGFTIPGGDMTPVKIPSPHAYNDFMAVDEIQGEAGLPTTSMIARFATTNPILRDRCPFHVQAHYGRCEQPTDKNGGWEKILGYSHARYTSRAGDEQTALDEAGRTSILLTGEITAREFWEVDRMTLGEVADAEVLRTVVSIKVRDYLSCGDCGYESDGDNRIFAVVESSGAGSPGLPAELLVSYDGGLTWAEHDIFPFTGDMQPTDVELVGQYIVVPTDIDPGMSFAPLSDLDAWTYQNIGYVAGAGPNAIYSQAPTLTWLVGNNGYVYFMTNPAAGVTVQSAGTATAEDLLAVHAFDSRNVVAVGENGAIIFTTNGGRSWSASATSPTVHNINTVWMRSNYTWVIGDAGGYVWFTRDRGATWAEAAEFPFRGQGGVYDICFSRTKDSPYGFMVAAQTFTPSMTDPVGYLLRTIDGGDTWYQLPEGDSPTPFNRGLWRCSSGFSPNFVAACGRKYWDAQEPGTGDDGIIIIGA